MIGFLFAVCFAAGIGLLVMSLAGRGPEWDDLARLVRQRRRRDPRALVSPGLVAAALVSALVAAGLVWSLIGVPVIAIAAGVAGAYAPAAWMRRRWEVRARERERAWPTAINQLADALEAGIAFPAAVALLGEAGPGPLRGELAAFASRLRGEGFDAALDGLAAAGERAADTVVLLLRAGLGGLPSGRLAPVLRELAQVLGERFEARERARSRASSLQVEAAILAVSPIGLLLLIGAASPGYLDAYRTGAGTAVALVGGLLIFGCYLLMRRLGRVPEPRRTGGQR